MSRGYTVRKVSLTCQVSVQAVSEWIEKGDLPVIKTVHGHKRIRHEDLISFLKKSHRPIPPALLEEKRKVLAVDDDDAIVRGLARLIERLDKEFLVEMAEDGEEAARKMQTFEPDLVLLDLRMPKMDGFKVCESIRAKDPKRNVKILALTGYSSDETRRKILDQGADDYIAKPFQIETLAFKVAHLLGLSPRCALSKVSFGRGRKLFF